MRSRLIALLAVAAVVFGVVVAGAAVALSRSPAPKAAASETPLPPDADYAVALSGDALLRGGAGPHQLPCRIGAIRRSATTLAVADGVVGLITLRGRGCSLDISPIRLRLLGANGAPLTVGRSAGNPVNAAFSVRPDIAEGFGSVRVGFAWSGSYCGPPPASVEIQLYDQPFVIPLTGPAPRCVIGLTSALIPGVLDGPGNPVIPAPVSWQSLSARVELPPTVPRGPIPFRVTLTNHSSRDVSLAAPCAAYRASLTYVVNFADVTSDSTGDLCNRPIVVPARGSRVLDLGRISAPGLSAGDQGDRETITWTLAGLPPAQASTFIQ